LLLKEPRFAGVTPRNSGWPLHTSSQRHSCNSHSCASVQYSSVPSPWEWNHRGQPVPNGNNLDRVSSTRLDPGKDAHGCCRVISLPDGQLSLCTSHVVTIC
jgi:hypothetical protein